MSDRSDYIRVVQTATSRGAIDLIAVERAVNGSAPENMTGFELHEATHILIGQGLKATAISAQLRVPVETLRGWFPVELAPRVVDSTPWECGTVRGYRHCTSDAGRACRKCRAANSANDYARCRRVYGAVAAPPLPQRPTPHERDGRQDTRPTPARPHSRAVAALAR